MRYIDDGALPADNNSNKDQIRSITFGRSNWIFAREPLRAGKRAAALKSLIQSATVNWRNLYGYLRSVFDRLTKVASSDALTFIPVPLAPVAPTFVAGIRIELLPCATTVNVTSPMTASADCVDLLRD